MKVPTGLPHGADAEALYWEHRFEEAVKRESSALRYASDRDSAAYAALGMANRAEKQIADLRRDLKEAHDLVTKHAAARSETAVRATQLEKQLDRVAERGGAIEREQIDKERIASDATIERLRLQIDEVCCSYQTGGTGGSTHACAVRNVLRAAANAALREGRNDTLPPLFRAIRELQKIEGVQTAGETSGAHVDPPPGSVTYVEPGELHTLVPVMTLRARAKAIAEHADEDDQDESVEDVAFEQLVGACEFVRMQHGVLTRKDAWQRGWSQGWFACRKFLLADLHKSGSFPRAPSAPEDT
jgi:hypothetical protein